MNRINDSDPKVSADAWFVFIIVVVLLVWLFAGFGMSDYSPEGMVQHKISLDA